ncbi:MAG: hypothetical protein ACO36I_19575, partial [Candidatus Latescibacterota bacterium]
GQGQRWVRDRIVLMNALAEHYVGHSIRVTAVVKDSPFHREGEAFDVGRMSAATQANTDWTLYDFEVMEPIWLEHRIPLVIVNKGQDNEHYHVGDVATLLYERE